MKISSQHLFVLFIFTLIVNTSWSQNTGAISKPDSALHLFSPSGKFGVGRHWTSIYDPSRNNREIPVFIYYPVQQKNAATFILPTEEWRKQYLPVLEKRLGAKAASAITSGKAEMKQDAEPTFKGKLPLILFSAGMNWSTLEYSFIIQELVSEGYIVVAVNSSPAAPVLQSPTGAFLSSEKPADIYSLVADDLRFVLKEIATGKSNVHKVLKQADLTHVAIAGHSLGGAAALLAATDINQAKTNNPNENKNGSGDVSNGLQNFQVKAAVNMDGDLMNASQQAAPGSAVLFLNQVPQAIAHKNFGEMKNDSSVGWRYQSMAKAATNSPNGRYISIAGMYHSNFQDYALLPVDMIPEHLRKTRLGPVDGKACLQLISKVLVVYFNEMLKNQITDWNLFSKQQPLLRVIDIKE